MHCAIWGKLFLNLVVNFNICVPSLILLCLNSFANLSSSSRSIFSSAGRSSLPFSCWWWWSIKFGEIEDLWFVVGENAENGGGDTDVKSGGEFEQTEVAVVDFDNGVTGIRLGAVKQRLAVVGFLSEISSFTVNSCCIALCWCVLWCRGLWSGFWLAMGCNIRKDWSCWCRVCCCCCRAAWRVCRSEVEIVFGPKVWEGFWWKGWWLETAAASAAATAIWLCQRTFWALKADNWNFD